MKLATYKDGSRDGQLVVVSRDLTTAHYATGIASRLQQALDDWNFIAPQLQDLYEALNAGRARHPFPFDAAQCMAPLPRAYQLLSAAQYIDTNFRRSEIANQTSDSLLGARSPIRVTSYHWASLNAGLAVITGDVPPGATPEQGQDAIRLVTLISKLALIRGEIEHDSYGEGDTAALGPVAITPDELGAAWRDSRVHLPFRLTVNDRLIGPLDAGDMRWSFGEIIATATESMLPLTAGTIVGSGLLHRSYTGLALWWHGKDDDAQAEGRNDLLRAGDIVRIEMPGPDGQSLFGAIEQTVE